MRAKRIAVYSAFWFRGAGLLYCAYFNKERGTFDLRFFLSKILEMTVSVYNLLCCACLQMI